MRKFVCFIVAALAVAASLSSTVRAGIAGSPHDLSTKGLGTGELCKFCHTPHLAQAVSGAPLWNHQTTTATYTMYDSTTFQGKNNGQTQPGATSKLCLSCHDGSVAVDSFANAGVIQSGTHFIGTTNRVGYGAALTNDHPIAFNYDAALVALDPGLVTPVSSNQVDAAGLIPLYNKKMECASCHTSHDNSNAKFLRVSNISPPSGLCLKCHNK